MKQATLIRKVDAFGWCVANFALAEGCSYGAIIGAPMPRSAIGTHTLFTKGEIQGLNLTTGDPIASRVAGTFSGDLGPILAGRIRLTAHSDAEWWCLDRAANGGMLPGAQAHRLQAGDTLHGLLLICSGPDAGSTFKKYTAEGECFALALNQEAP